MQFQLATHDHFGITTILFCVSLRIPYRVYNVFNYKTVNSNGNEKTVPYVFVGTVVQEVSGERIVYVLRGIEITTYNQSSQSNAVGSPSTIGSKYTVPQLYKIVNTIPRKDGGLKYTAQEKADYLFAYTKREDGAQYLID